MTTIRQPSFKQYPFKREGLQAIVLRQLQVQDDVEVGMRLDKAIKNDPRGNSMTLTSYMLLQKRESVRLSIVAVLRDGEDPETGWEKVNDTEPFAEMSEWLDTSYARLQEMHRDINEVTEEEDFRKAAVTLSPAEVVARIGRGQSGTTARAEAGSAAPAGG